MLLAYTVPLPADAGSPQDVLSPIPWQVSLRYEDHENYKHACGGTILDSKTILTAAHCTHYDLGALKIVAGTKFSNVSMSGQDGIQIRNTHFFNHLILLFVCLVLFTKNCLLFKMKFK